MGAVVMLKVFFLVLSFSALAPFLVFQGSAGDSLSPSSPSAFSPDGHATAPPVLPGNVFQSSAPTPAYLPKGTPVDPSYGVPLINSAPAPQNWNDHVPYFPPSTLVFTPPLYPTGIVPALPPSAPSGSSSHVEYPSPQVLAPLASPSRISPQNPPKIRAFVPVSLPPKPDQHKAPEAPLLSTAPVPSASAPLRVLQNPPPTYPVIPKISPSNAPVPVASSPSMLSGSPPSFTPALPKHPPISSSDPKTDLRLHAPPPSSSGSSIAPSLLPHPPTKSYGPYAPLPYLAIPSQQLPLVSPKMSPSGFSPRMSKMPLQPPFQALPPPPPNEDCASLTCSGALTNGPPGSPCICVLPMQVGLRLNVALYNFFPLVSEFASEIAAGVFLKLSQVRIMGANAASDDPEKTIVLTDLVPLGENFDSASAYLIFRRFWLKEVTIGSSMFGDYEVLYVRYPGLPPSPPSAPSYIGTINSDPYSGLNNNAAALKPLGVDVGRQHHRGGLSGSLIAIIVLSASVVVIFCCAIAWVLVLKQRERFGPPDSTRLATMPSVAKSSDIHASITGSGPSSASVSYGSSFAAYTGSAKSFSSSDIERATDNFSETRILGEGGFGRVYSGVLEDGTEVAVKVLKRADQQGGREFLAEVEMLSRLHHRNLVKLIGICTEENTRCLVYELIPNGSVESHLHGVHKESAPLDWGARLKIALGAARGLAYLHEDSSPRVIHRDFKSSNILLEHDFTPKVSDFGLARTALEEENKHISTRVMGTFGYVAPEYAMTGHLLVKSDVYSYGVVLLELLTSRKPVDMSQPPGQENLVSWARPLLTSNEGLESIIDPTLGPDFPFDSISKVAAIASMCVQPEVSNRPFMGEVVQALKLICNERDETKEMGSGRCSGEDLSVDMDAGTSGALDHSGVHLQGQYPVSSYDYDMDVERGFSTSDLLSSSARYAMQDSGSFGRHSGSGPLSIGKARRLFQKMKQLSGGTVSEHGAMLKSRRGGSR